MEYCPHCMRTASGEICSYCGGKVNWQAPASQLPVGTLLRGSNGRVYQIGAAKGQGGFGITYAALDLSLNFCVAIKEYYPTRCATRDHLNNVVPTTGHLETYQGGMRSFLEEGKMLSAVGALPSVVSVRDYFEANGTAYLVMEYVEGKALHDLLTKQGPMPKEFLFSILPELLRDLGILHRAGVIHRDISPDNLILTTEGKLKLLDFGSARSTENGKAMTVMLKAGFSPVEQYQSKGQGPYTDIYAMAGTIYYCLTGKLPPTAIDRLTEDELKSPNTYGANLTETEEQALLWGLNLQPSRRPQRAEAFANALLGTNFPVTRTGQQETDAYRVTTGEHPVADTIPVSRKQTTTRQTTDQYTATHHTATRQTTQDQYTTRQTTQDQYTTTRHKTVTGTDSGKKPAGKKGKKLLIPILAAVMVLVVLAGAAAAFLMGGEKTTSTGLVYQIKSDQVSITGYSGSRADLVIPSTIDGAAVTTIGQGAFSGQKNLTSVSIPASVKTVEKGAFENCPALEYINVKGSDTRMAKGAVQNCKNLRLVIACDETGFDRLEGAVSAMKDVALCYPGQDLGGNVIQEALVQEGVAYGLTGDSTAVVLLLPSGMTVEDLPHDLEGRRLFDAEGQRLGAVAGISEDGFLYEIVGGEAMLVGYNGSQAVLSLPEELEGCPITTLGARCFAENTTLESVFLPDALEEIQAEAFIGCTNLTDIYVYRQATVDPTAFSGCTALRSVVSNDIDLSGWHLPDICQAIYSFGMDTGAGDLLFVVVDPDNGVVYGVTDQDQAVLMYVPGSVKTVDVANTVNQKPVTWTYPGIKLAGNPVINMTGTMGFPYELLNKADWEFDSFGDFSHSWLVSCVACELINEQRPAEPYIYPEREVVESAMVRSEELSLAFIADRPDGSDVGDILNEHGVDWVSCNIYRQRFSDDDATYEEEFEDSIYTVVDAYVGKDSKGRDYVALGMAMYHDESGAMVYSATFAIIRQNG